MEYALFPMKNVSISRRAFKPGTTHTNLNAIDINGEDKSKEYGRAPCRCRVLKILPITATGYANTIIFGSCDQSGQPAEVLCADGVPRVLSFAFTHDHKIRVEEGQIVTQGEIVYAEGTTGNASGNHIHLEVGEGWQYKKVKNNYGDWSLQSLLFAYKVFWLKEGYHKVTNFGLNGYTFKWIKEGNKIMKVNNNVIHVLKELRDDKYDYRISVDGNMFGTPYDKTTMNGFSDKGLVAEGWEEVIATNGSIFYSYEGKTYAEGLEKSRGINNQPLEMHAVSKFNGTMAMGFDYDGNIDFKLQKDIAKDLFLYYGAVTSAFGLLKDGQVNIAGKELEHIRNYLFTGKSGRTVWGYNSNSNEYIVISVPGVTGQSGVTGSQLIEIAKDQGCTDAVCMDGGGSRWLRYYGQDLVTSSRAVKNAIILYRKLKKATVAKPVEDTKPIVEEPKTDVKTEIKETLLKLNELIEKL